MKMYYFRGLSTLLSFALLQIFVSCTTSRKTALACPKIPDARIENHARYSEGRKSNYYLLSYKNHEKRKPASVKGFSGIHNSSKNSIGSMRKIELKRNIKSSDYIEGINIDKNEFLKGLTASISNNVLIINPENLSSSVVSHKSKATIQRFNFSGIQEICDTIVSTLGDVIIGKVVEIGDSEIKYKRCGISDSPTYSVRKSNISAIKYANGTRDFFTNTTPVDYRYSSEERKIEGLGLAGFVSSLVGLIILGIPLGLVAITFGAISLSRIKRSPGRYKGRGFAIVSLVLGIIDIVGVIILLAITL